MPWSRRPPQKGSIEPYTGFSFVPRPSEKVFRTTDKVLSNLSHRTPPFQDTLLQISLINCSGWGPESHFLLKDRRDLPQMMLNWKNLKGPSHREPRGNENSNKIRHSSKVPVKCQQNSSQLLVKFQGIQGNSSKIWGCPFGGCLLGASNWRKIEVQRNQSLASTPTKVTSHRCLW